MMRKQSHVNCHVATRIVRSSTDCYCLEQCVQTDYAVLLFNMSPIAWALSSLSSPRSTYLIFIRRQTLRLQYSSFCSLVLTRLLTSRRLVSQTRSRLKLVRSPTSLWVKVKKKTRISCCRKLQRKATGACSKTCILCNLG